MRRGPRIVAYVRGILERDEVTLDSLAVRTATGDANLERGWTTPGALNQRDAETLQKVIRGSELSTDELIQLEAIVLPNGLRPSFDVLNDGFNDLPAPWADLNARRDTLTPLIRGIGRLNLVGNPGRPIGGTGFVVAPDLLMTNRHVAECLVDGIGSGASLQFKPGMAAVMDLKQEVDAADSLIVQVVAPVLILDTWDAALLRIGGLPSSVSALPLSGGSVPDTNARLSAVVGYPAFDPREDLAQQMLLFRSRFDKKRLMPGRLMGMRQVKSFGRDVLALAHDCTTLGNNSGSAVIDVMAGVVIGLHFAGESGVANYAVPTWELASENRITSSGVLFH